MLIHNDNSYILTFNFSPLQLSICNKFNGYLVYKNFNYECGTTKYNKNYFVSFMINYIIQYNSYYIINNKRRTQLSQIRSDGRHR